MKNGKGTKRNRVIMAVSLFLCLFLAVSNLQMIQADAAVAVPDQHYLTPYQTTNYGIYDNEELSFFNMMGEKYYQGILGGNTSGEKIALYNLDGEFTSVSFEVGHLDDGNTNDSVLNVYTDNNLVRQISLTGDMTTQTVTIDTKDVQQLKLSGTSGWGRYGIVNVIGAGGHVYESEVTKIATVKQVGVRTYTCKYCDQEYTEEIEAKTNCLPLLKPYQSKNVGNYVNDEISYFNIMGKRYYDGILGDNTSASKEVLYNLAQKYSEVTFTVGHLDNSNCNEATLTVYSDGTQQKAVTLTGDMIDETVTVNTEGVTQLKIVLGSGWGRYAIFDMHYVTDLKSEHSFKENIDEAAGIITYTCENCGAYYMEPYTPEMKVESIVLNKTALNMKTGQTFQLNATVSPKDANDKSVVWSSRDSSVASVDQKGKVTAAGEGSTVITASAGDVTVQCEVTVEAQKDDNDKDKDDNDKDTSASLSLSASAVTLYTGNVSNTTWITANVTGNSRRVTWHTSDSSVASVTSGGKITAVSSGTAIVTAEANGIKKTVRVVVKKPSITVKKSGKNVKSVTVKRKRSVKLSVSVKPSKSGVKLSPLTKKQKKIAGVRLSGNKLVISGKKKGTFKVKIKSGTATKTIKITVKR